MVSLPRGDATEYPGIVRKLLCGKHIPPGVRFDPQGALKVWLDDRANELLLAHDGKGRVDDGQAELVHHAIILAQNASLEDAIALVGVVTQAEIQTRLIMFQARATGHDPTQRLLKGHPQRERDGRDGRKGVDFANPLRIDAPSRIASEGGVDVAVSEDHSPGPERGHDLLLMAVRKVYRVDEAEGRGREQSPLLASFGGLAYHRG